MKAKISALMDGEFDEHELSDSLSALARDDEVRHCWRIYHLIGDAMHDCCVLSKDFNTRLAERLAGEPTVLAPARTASRWERGRWLSLAAAAGVAAVSLVGWLEYAPREAVAPAGPAAVTAQVAPTAGPVVAAAKTRVPARVPLPSGTNDYLLAHQAYSPRITLQGMAPYVRTVSDEAVGGASR